MGSDTYEDGIDEHESKVEIKYLDHLLEDDCDEDGKLKDDSIEEEMELQEDEQRIFLVKVPDYVYDGLFNVKEEGLEVGFLRNYNQLIKTEDNVITDHMVHLPEHFQSIPRDYTLEITNPNVKNTYIFEEFENKVAKRVIGTVVKECIMKPISTDPVYRNILRKRTLEQGKNEKTIKFDDSDKNNSLEHLKPNAFQQGLLSFGNVGKRTRMDPENRASRMDDKDLRQLLFKCFEEYVYWSFNGLLRKTNQPSAHLKNILKEIAFLNKRGSHHTLYELLPEYRQQNNFQNADTDPNNNPFNLNKRNYGDSNVIDIEDDEEEDAFEEVE